VDDGEKNFQFNVKKKTLSYTPRKGAHSFCLENYFFAAEVNSKVQWNIQVEDLFEPQLYNLFFSTCIIMSKLLSLSKTLVTKPWAV
jgi:hypothetical protein